MLWDESVSFVRWSCYFLPWNEHTRDPSTGRVGVPIGTVFSLPLSGGAHRESTYQSLLL